MHKPIGIYIVEDYPLLQRLLTQMVERSPKLALCGVSSTAENALKQIPTLEVTLVLVDFSLPLMNGVELVRILSQLSPSLSCLMLSGHIAPYYVRQALKAGAQGYLSKGDIQELDEAITQVLTGVVYLSQSVRDTFEAL